MEQPKHLLIFSDVTIMTIRDLINEVMARTYTKGLLM